MLNKLRIVCIVLLLISVISVLVTFIAPLIPNLYSSSESAPIIGMLYKCSFVIIDIYFAFSSGIAYIVSYRLKKPSYLIISTIVAYLYNLFLAGFNTLIGSGVFGRKEAKWLITMIYLLFTALITVIYIILSTKKSDIPASH